MMEENDRTVTAGIPVIDPGVRYVGVSKLRELKAEKLRALDQTLVIQDDERPLAVMLSYDSFLEMQNERERIVATLRLLSRRVPEIFKSIADAKAGKGKSFQDIQKSLRAMKSLNEAVPGLTLEEIDDLSGDLDRARGKRLQQSARKDKAAA